MKIGSLLVAVIAISLPLALVYAQAESVKFSPYVDDSGNISMPEDFRLNMVHLGSWMVPQGDASGFHDVYTEQKSARYYRKNGVFPDGATLVKELRPSAKGNYTTGANVSYATSDIKQWFVMVKDAKGRFKNNALWGDGWGWGLFKLANADTKTKSVSSTKNIATNYQTDCLGCHIPAKKDDFVYIEAYPTLLEP